MVKLQKQTAYEYKGHPIFKYRINLPTEVIDEIKWKHGQELDVIIKNDNEIIIRSLDKK